MSRLIPWFYKSVACKARHFRWNFIGHCHDRVRQDSFNIIERMMEFDYTEMHSRYCSTHDSRPNRSTHKVKVARFRLKIYGHLNELEVEENVIYKPQSLNEEAIDAFLHD